jgi:sugar O-acyltransferase (sialic acid O-acetyltransferase NeuD family)
MPIKRVSLIGAGGHAKVVLEALRAASPKAMVQVLDESRAGGRFLGIAVAQLAAGARMPGAVHVAIGDAAARERLSRAAARAGARLLTVIHPRAVVSPSARLADGVFAAALCVIGPDAVVGRGAIINHGTVIDHDCAIGDWTHVAPNATLGGGVSVGKSVMVGAGAVVLPGVRVGDRAVLGAGAVVLDDVPAGSKVAGVPAVRVDKARR